MPRLDARDPAAIEEAACRLAEGGLLAFPTETVYGLGARADDDRAVGAIYAAKGRPADHPLIVHVADLEHALAFTPALDGAARRLAERAWPGPLTLIVRRRDGIGRAAAAGQSTIGLRVPSNPVAQALLRAAHAQGVAGVAAPSANRFGRVSPTRADHVEAEFGPSLWVLDGGPCELGIESTIVDCTRGEPALLRPGQLDRRRVEAMLGGPLAAPGSDAPRASGTLEAHYAPRAAVRLYTTAELARALAEFAENPAAAPRALAVYSRTAFVPPPAGVRWRPMPVDPAPAAHELYAALRGFDAEGAEHIWVEEPPCDPAWEGVRDRLQRAAVAASGRAARDGGGAARGPASE